jgi:excisionase family DNA binding protein
MIAEAPEARLLSIPLAAKYLSCAQWAVRELLWQERVPFIRLGRRYVIDRRDLDAFIEQSKN